MICPECDNALERKDDIYHIVNETKTKPPKLGMVRYRVKECLKCNKLFYVKGKKIEALKGD